MQCRTTNFKKREREREKTRYFFVACRILLWTPLRLLWFAYEENKNYKLILRLCFFIRPFSLSLSLSWNLKKIINFASIKIRLLIQMKNTHLLLFSFSFYFRILCNEIDLFYSWLSEMKKKPYAFRQEKNERVTIKRTITMSK